MNEPTIAELTREFITARDAKNALREQQKLELAPLLEDEFNAEAKLLDLLNQQGLQSAPNEFGTPYKSVLNSYPIADWDSFLSFVLENNLTHMIERRSSKSSVEEFREAQGELPPGLGMKSVVRVRVRGK